MILWKERRIRVSKRWAGSDGETKTEASDGYVPLHPLLTEHLRDWHERTPYAKDTDFLFPSLKMKGRIPMSAAIFVQDHLRPAAIAAGVQIPEGQGFGLHNLRHSLSNWLVNKAKVEPKTVQGILCHAQDSNDARSLHTGRQRRKGRTGPVSSSGHGFRGGSVKLRVGLWIEVRAAFPANLLKKMVGTRGLEPLTSTVSR